MKKLIFIPTMLLIMYSMSIQAQTKFVLNPNGAKDEAVVKDFMEAMLSRDPAKLEKNHASDYIGYGPRWDSPETKKDMILHIQSIWDRFDDIRHERQRFMNVTVSGDEIPEYNGNWVFVWGVFAAKDKNTGKEFFLDVHQIFKVANEKITGSVVYYNQLDNLIQTGQYEVN